MDNFFTPTLHSNNYSRTYSKGKSFKFSEWNAEDVYNNDEFIQDFVKYDNKLWACREVKSYNDPPSESKWILVLDGVADLNFQVPVDNPNKIQWKCGQNNEWNDLIEFDTISENSITEMLEDLEMQSGTVYDSELSETSTNAVQNKVITEELGKKVSKTNMATINGKSLTKGGNIVIEGDGKITVDSALSTTSENPVQNKVITEKLNKKASIDGIYPDLTAGDLAGRGESVPASFGFRASGGKSIKDGRAYIKRIKGNSVVWNQSCKPFSEAIRFPHDSVILTEQGVSLTNWDAYQPFVLPANLLAKKGHKCLLMFSYTNTTPSPQFAIEVAETSETRFTFTQASESVAIFLNIAQSSITDNINVFPYVNQTGECTISNIRFYDLTKMFQAGNEPSTIEEFNAREATLGVDMYAYNEGQVIHCNTESIKSVGDNAWDEQWENGTFDITSGEAIDGSWVMGQIRSKNPLPILPNEEYYVSMSKGSLWVIFLDKEGNAIESPAHKGITAGNAINIFNSGRFKTPTNAAFLIFYCTSDYGDTYNHDILISLYHSGWKAQKDDQYQPYWQDTLPLPIISKYFPDGMKLAGSAHDEIRYNKASGKWEYSKGRIKEVDLGSLDWATGNDSIFIAVLNDMNPALNTITGIMAKYNLCTSANGSSMISGDDKTYITNGGAVGGAGRFTIKDTSYTDAASFKADMAGVILYYESNDWEWVELDAEDQNFRDYYQVADFGTEMSQSNVPSAAFSADIIYQFNAVDMIREHEMEIREHEEDIKELQSIIATMQAQLTSLIDK